MRAFFLGAGASRADGFPLTREIVDGVIHAAIADQKSDHRILRFLRAFFRFSDADLQAAANRWTALSSGNAADAESAARRRLPDVVELLSLVDVLITDESFVCGEIDGGELEPFSTRDLLRVRESISRAVAKSFKAFAMARRRTPMPPVAEAFAEMLRVDDVVITTNWDLLLDEALHARFSTDRRSTGTDAVILTASGDRARERRLERPGLYKLHGSLNWLVCLRCTTLYVNPTVYIADLGFYHSTRSPANACDCGMPLRPTLITPTYFKQYRVRHFASIWTRAQQRLAECDEWYFIGYSLPVDDVHIRALLLKAWHTRVDAGLDPPRIQVITSCPGEPALKADDAMLLRYGGMFPLSCIDISGFRDFVTRASASA